MAYALRLRCAVCGSSNGAVCEEHGQAECRRCHRRQTKREERGASIRGAYDPIVKPQLRGNFRCIHCGHYYDDLSECPCCEYWACEGCISSMAKTGRLR